MISKDFDVEGGLPLKEVIKAVLARADSSSVSMLKEIREATEGSKVALSGEDGNPIEVVVKYAD